MVKYQTALLLVILALASRAGEVPAEIYDLALSATRKVQRYSVLFNSQKVHPFIRRRLHRPRRLLPLRYRQCKGCASEIALACRVSFVLAAP